jgi:ribonuclease R
VTLSETGADGLIPMRSLGGDFYVHDEARHRLVGRRWGRTFTIGDPLRVRLAEANAVTGSLLFALVEADEHAVRKPEESGGIASFRRKGSRSKGRTKRR